MPKKSIKTFPDPKYCFKSSIQVEIKHQDGKGIFICTHHHTGISGSGQGKAQAEKDFFKNLKKEFDFLKKIGKEFLGPKLTVRKMKLDKMIRKIKDKDIIEKRREFFKKKEIK